MLNAEISKNNDSKKIQILTILKNEIFNIFSQGMKPDVDAILITKEMLVTFK